MKALSLILKIAAGLVAVIIIAIAVIVVTVDPNDYRDEITQAVKKETGRDLKIEAMSLSFFPHLGLNLKNTSLSNATGFSEPLFLKVDKVQVGAAILPLLSQRLEIDTLTLHGLTLNLEKSAEGINNWDDLIKQESDDTVEVEAIAEESANPLDKLAAINFGGIDIQEGQVHWNDQQAQQSVDLKITELSTGTIAFGDFFEIALSAETTVAKPALKSQIDLTIEAKIEKDGRYFLRNLALKSTTQGSGIPVEKATAELSIPTLDLAMAKNQLSLPSLTLAYNVIGGKEFPMQTIQGKLRLKEFNGDLKAQQFKAQELTVNTTLTGESLPGGKTKINLSAQPRVDISAQTANLDQLSLSAMDIVAKGSVKATQITSDALVDAKLDIANTNLRALLKELEITLPEMADATTLTKFAASLGLHFNVKTQAVSVQQLNVTLDDTLLTGSASVTQFDAPNIHYDLALTKMDLNRYLPAKKSGAGAKSEKTPPTAESDIPLPTELLRKLTIDGRFKAQAVTFDKLQPKNILLTLKGSKGKFNANPIRADIFKTTIHAQAGLDVRGKTPLYSFKTDAKNVPIGDVMMAFTDKDQISGTGAVTANITTSGSRVSHFKQNLNGTAAANLEDGAIKGFNLAQSIREAKAKISGTTAPTQKGALQTDFSSLIVQASIKQGIVTTTKLLAQAPFMRITGSGTVDLPKSSLDYLVNAKIVASDKGQGGEDLKELNGLTIPVKLKGDWTSPSVSLDLASLLEQKATAEMEKKKDEVIEETKKKIEEQLEDTLLKGFKF
ncbi:MAG: AsmA family protein [Pseudomonadota bacterium]